MPQTSAYMNFLFDDEPFVDRIDRVADAGFDGFELFGWDRDFAAIEKKRDQHGLEMVCLSGERRDLTNPDNVQEGMEHIEQTLELAAKKNCRRLNVKAGSLQPDIDRNRQQESVIQALSRVAPIAEQRNVTLVLEPLNTRIDHPGHFLTTAQQAAEIIEAVDSEYVRLLFDVYHEQIMSGDVIRSFKQHSKIIDHVHIADNPGRHEPGTGELDYQNIIKAITDTGYDGYIGFEFTPTCDFVPVLREIQSLI